MWAKNGGPLNLLRLRIGVAGGSPKKWYTPLLRYVVVVVWVAKTCDLGNVQSLACPQDRGSFARSGNDYIKISIATRSKDATSGS